MSRFPEFWSAYPPGPRKVNKRGCEAKWKARKLDGIADVILHGLRKWCESAAWAEKNGAFVPMPATWLNQDRWEAADMLTPAPAKAAVQVTQELLADMSRHAQEAAKVAPETMQRAREVRARIMEARLQR